jgi:tripartite-type tricarboxylate transporter receptor subunit TctC
MLMNTLRKFSAGVAVAAVAATAMTFGSYSSHAEWKPNKPIEFVIMAGKGGGADKMARLMQSVVEKHKMSPMPLLPVNKPGGSGAEALVHLNGKSGADANHTIMVTLNSFYTTPLRQPALGVDSLTFAPIARMAEDTFLLWVHKDSGIKDVDAFVKAAKAKGNDWIMAGTGKASEDNLLTDFLNSAYGLEMKYVPYKGEQEGFYASGDTVPIAAFTDDRLPMFPDAPTFKEIGKDFEYYMQRSVVGAPKMSAEALAFYQGLFKQVFESDEWQTYRKKKSLRGDLISGDAMKAYWQTNNEIHRQMLIKMGAIKG